MGVLVRVQKTRILIELHKEKTRIKRLIGMQTVKARFMRLQVGMKTVLETGREVMHLSFRQGVCLLFAEFKDFV